MYYLLLCTGRVLLATGRVLHLPVLSCRVHLHQERTFRLLWFQGLLSPNNKSQKVTNLATFTGYYGQVTDSYRPGYTVRGPKNG